MSVLPGLRHRLPLIVLMAGAAFLALDSWIELELTLRSTRQAILVHAAGIADRGRDSLGAAPTRGRRPAGALFAEMAGGQPGVRLLGVLRADGRLAECAPESLGGARLDSLLGPARGRPLESWNQPGGSTARMLRDRRVVATSRPFDGARAGTSVVCVLDARDRLAAVTRSVNTRSVPGAALGLAIILALAWVLERWLHEPSKRLQSAAARFAGGDLAARAHLRGEDEFAQVGAAFDRMADEVERTEQELMAARARLDSVLNALPVGVSVVARDDGRILYLNSRLRELAGLPPERDTDGPRSQQRLDVRGLDGQPVPPAELATGHALATGKPATTTGHVLVRPDGERVPHVAHAVPISLSGDADYDAIITIIQDQREVQRLSEEAQLWRRRYESAAEAAGRAAREPDPGAGPDPAAGDRGAPPGESGGGREAGS